MISYGRVGGSQRGTSGSKLAHAKRRNRAFESRTISRYRVHRTCGHNSVRSGCVGRKGLRSICDTANPLGGEESAESLRRTLTGDRGRIARAASTYPALRGRPTVTSSSPLPSPSVSAARVPYATQPTCGRTPFRC